MRAYFLAGLAGKRPGTPITYDAMAEKAQRMLRPESYAYLAGGAGREQTISANRQALDAITIHPHMLGGAAAPDTTRTWRNIRLPAPVMLAPIGVLELAHHDADLAVARAAASTGVPMIISSQASTPMEKIADALGDAPRLYQLYHGKSDDVSRSFIRRAEAIGCRALVVTLDTTMLGWRARDLAYGFNPFLLGQGIAQYTSDPAFQQLPTPETSGAAPPLTTTLLANLMRINRRVTGRPSLGRAGIQAAMKFIANFNNPGMTWDDIARIRTWTRMPVYLKGILRADDATKAAGLGIDGIIVSNHGGRQVDGAVASVAALPSILAAAGDRLDVWVDSGIRAGSDVFKCIGLGATGVLIGRPFAMALACNGQQGVEDCVQNIIAELELTMALSGAHNLDDINHTLITHPWTNT
jgi:lactate 2-monooxygenase